MMTNRVPESKRRVCVPFKLNSFDVSDDEESNKARDGKKEWVPTSFTKFLLVPKLKRRKKTVFQQPVLPIALTEDKVDNLVSGRRESLVPRVYSQSPHIVKGRGFDGYSNNKSAIIDLKNQSQTSDKYPHTNKQDSTSDRNQEYPATETIRGSLSLNRFTDKRLAQLLDIDSLKVRLNKALPRKTSKLEDLFASTKRVPEHGKTNTKDHDNTKRLVKNVSYSFIASNRNVSPPVDLFQPKASLPQISSHKTPEAIRILIGNPSWMMTSTGLSYEKSKSYVRRKIADLFRKERGERVAIKLGLQLSPDLKT